jgi:hypothetical protein
MGRKDKKEVEEESVFHKKLKIKLKQKGKEGRIELLKDYVDYLLRNNKFLPPDFPAFAREVMGTDSRGEFIHIRIYSDKCELVEFAKNKGYTYTIDQFD